VSKIKCIGSRGATQARSAVALGLLLGSASVVGAQPADPAPAPAPTPAPVEPAPAEPTPAPAPTPVAEAAPAGEPLTSAQVDAVKREIAAAPKMFEFHGYFRSGLGVNTKGGDQEAFQAPGAFTKYRLGNETESYGEVSFTQNWLNPEKDGVALKTSVMLAVVAPRNSTFDVLDAIALREAFAEASKVIESKPEMSFWAGQRFYRRKDVHITDFFYHDMSAYGGGFQDLKLGQKPKLALAVLGASTNDGDPTDAGRPFKTTLDARIYGIGAGKGNVELWLAPSFVADGNADSNGVGVAAGVFHEMPFMGGFNKLSVQFGFNSGANLSAGLQGDIDESGWMLRVIEQAQVNVSPKLSMMWTGSFQLDNRNGDADGSTGNMWISAGIRPIYSFTKYTGIAFEGGVDLVQPEMESSDAGFLGKVTVAPVIRPGLGFWQRPELRAFVTAAVWNDSIKGAVGGAPHEQDTFGLSAGVQMESWW
jgi:maltoporin